ncbi:MAG: T9SS type A sorting domain-containing protein [Bacteroidales bacterium]|nr:T9SS type A sorting domain-containing protein [Bacteroidales bacterium]
MTLVSYSSSMFMGGIVIAINPEGEYIWSQFPSMAQYDAQPLSDGGYLFIGNGPLWGVKDVSEPQIGLVRVNDMGEGISCTEPILSSAFEYQINFEAITYTSEETGTISDYILETTEFPLASFIGCVTFVGNTQERPDRKNSLKIQPNPGNPPFLHNLKGIHNEVVASLIIYDSKGRKIYQEEGSWQQLQLIQRKLKSGLYLIKVTVEGFDYVSKLIVAEE